MKNLIKSIGTLAITLVMLAACNLKAGGPATEQPGTESAITAEATTEASPTEEIPIFEPAGGALLGWWDGSNAVYVPEGEFLMGDQDAITGDNIPAHTVSLDAFWIQKVEVTNQMYSRCVALGLCQPPQAATGLPEQYTNQLYSNFPVVGVPWEDARTYCEWIGGRLPSEAEWEKAARGTNGDPYPWGDEEEPSCSLLNYADCLNPPLPMLVGIHDLGDSLYKVADMAGNVAEWVNDWYADDYYGASPSANPAGPADGDFRVVRGSSYLEAGDSLLIHQRANADPDSSRADLGFRCIITPGQTPEESVLPACTTFSYVPIPRDIPTPASYVIMPPAFSINAYCNLVNNNQFGSAVIRFEDGTDVNQVTISASHGTLTCTHDIVDPMKFTCVGTALNPGTSVTIKACYPPAPALPGMTPTCPVFYTYRPATNRCEYGVPIPVSCAAPDVVVPFYGCLPAPVNDQCPVGSYAGLYNNKPVCIPASGPQCYGNLCPAVCPEGLVFNEGSFCCDYPPDVTPACPVGFMYDASSDLCLPQPSLPVESCTSITVSVGTCPPVPQVNCSDHSSESACNADSNCQWHPYLAQAGGYCTNK
jgi:hypothetical protein